MVAVGGLIRGADSSGSWSAVTAAPHGALGGTVHRYGGFHESRGGPVVRTELPSTDIVLVLDLTRNLAVGRPSPPTLSPDGVVAGVGRTSLSTRHPGDQVALEVRMSPLAAQPLLGIPGGALSEKLVEVGELCGRAGGELLERASQLESWRERFSLLEGFLLARQRDAAPAVGPDPALVAAHRLVLHRQGDVSMRELLELTGWSRRRLAVRFREQVGMTPKGFARLARFRHAERLLRSPGHRSLASIALTCGYCDQAHLNRDFRDLAGCTPTAHLTHLRSDPAAADMAAG